jgi:hypothetical protein
MHCFLGRRDCFGRGAESDFVERLPWSGEKEMANGPRRAVCENDKRWPVRQAGEIRLRRR